MASGSRSSLPCSSGTQKLWMTSADVSRSSTGSPTGMCSSLATVTPCVGVAGGPPELVAGDLDLHAALRRGAGDRPHGQHRHDEHPGQEHRRQDDAEPDDPAGRLACRNVVPVRAFVAACGAAMAPRTARRRAGTQPCRRRAGSTTGWRCPVRQDRPGPANSVRRTCPISLARGASAPCRLRHAHLVGGPDRHDDGGNRPGRSTRHGQRAAGGLDAQAL